MDRLLGHLPISLRAATKDDLRARQSSCIKFCGFLSRRGSSLVGGGTVGRVPVLATSVTRILVGPPQ